MPSVSIVIPAFRVTPYITEALDSVFAQTITDFEVIVVNDCCPDTVNLERTLAPYLARIRYLKLDRNGGVAAARNAGIEAAISPYVAFLDADDRWDPRYLEIHLGMLLRDPALDVVYGNARVFGPSSDAGLVIMDTLPSTGEVNFSSLMSLRCNVSISATVRREILLRVGGFDVRQRRCEDFDLWLRIAKAGGKFAYHREVVLLYRRRDESQSSDGRVSLRAMIEYCEKVKREFDLTPEELSLVDRQRAAFSAQLAMLEGREAFEAGRTGEAIAHFKSAQDFRRSRKLAWIIRTMQVAPWLLRWMNRQRNRRILTRAAAQQDQSYAPPRSA